MKAAKHINRGHTIMPVWAITVGAGICILSTILLSIVSALLISNENLPQEATKTISVITQILSAFLGCTVAMYLVGRMPAVVSAITCGVYFLILMCGNILFMNGEFGGVGEGILSIICGGVLSVGLKLLGRKKNKIRIPRLS